VQTYRHFNLADGGVDVQFFDQDFAFTVL